MGNSSSKTSKENSKPNVNAGHISQVQSIGSSLVNAFRRRKVEVIENIFKNQPLPMVLEAWRRENIFHWFVLTSCIYTPEELKSLFQLFKQYEYHLRPLIQPWLDDRIDMQVTNGSAYAVGYACTYLTIGSDTLSKEIEPSDEDDEGADPLEDKRDVFHLKFSADPRFWTRDEGYHCWKVENLPPETLALAIQSSFFYPKNTGVEDNTKLVLQTFSSLKTGEPKVLEIPVAEAPPQAKTVEKTNEKVKNWVPKDAAPMPTAPIAINNLNRASCMEPSVDVAPPSYVPVQSAVQSTDPSVVSLATAAVETASIETESVGSATSSTVVC